MIWIAAAAAGGKSGEVGAESLCIAGKCEVGSGGDPGWGIWSWLVGDPVSRNWGDPDRDRDGDGLSGLSGGVVGKLECSSLPAGAAMPGGPGGDVIAWGKGGSGGPARPAAVMTAGSEGAIRGSLGASPGRLGASPGKSGAAAARTRTKHEFASIAQRAALKHLAISPHVSRLHHRCDTEDIFNCIQLIS